MSLLLAILFLIVCFLFRGGIWTIMRYLWMSLYAPFYLLYVWICYFGACVVGSMRFLAGIRKWRDKAQPTHGDAKMSGWDDLKHTPHAKPDGWLMGVFLIERWWGRAVTAKRVYAESDACVIGVAPRRTGKSNMAKAQLIAQATREVKPDVICVDPHGDIRPAVLQTFISQGYQTLFLNFEKPRESDHYNPMSFPRLHDYYLAKDADQIMKLVMAEEKGSNAHFTDFPRLVLAGLMAYKLRTDPMNAKLHQIVELAVADDKARAAVFEKMMRDGGPIERAGVSAFRNAGERERGSFSTTMARKLGVWLRPGFVHITGTDGFTWEQVFLDSRPVVVFVTTGGSNIEGAAARLILGNAINTRIQMWPDVQTAYQGVGQPRFPKELRIMVDETRLLGNCEAIVTAVTETGKMGVSLMMWVLGMRDIFDTYPEASVLTNSCNAVIFGGGMEMSTYEDFSRAIGEKTIANPGYSESDNGSSQSVNDQARRERKADELRRTPADELVAIMGTTSIQPKKPVKVVGEGEDKRLVFL